MATDEEIEEQRARVEKLRAALEDNERAVAEREREAANEITLTNLQAEEARLIARLAEQESSIARTEGDRASSPINAAKADMERAVLIQRATADQLTGKTPQAKPASDGKPVETGPVETPPPPPPPAESTSTTKTQKGGK